MDDTSKLKMMLFFDLLRREMNNTNNSDIRRYGVPGERGYFIAVDKMESIIQEFIDNEINDDGSLRK